MQLGENDDRKFNDPLHNSPISLLVDPFSLDVFEENENQKIKNTTTSLSNHHSKNNNFVTLIIMMKTQDRMNERLQVLQNQLSPPSPSSASSSSSTTTKLIGAQPCQATQSQSPNNNNTTNDATTNSLNPTYHTIFPYEQIKDTIPHTTSINDIRAFHSDSPQSLASRLLRARELNLSFPLSSNNNNNNNNTNSPKTLQNIELRQVRARENTWRELAKNDYRIDLSWNPAEYRRNVKRQFLKFAQTGLVTIERVNTDLWSFLGVLEPLLTYDVSFTAMIAVHYQLYGCCLFKLGSQRHEHLFPMANLGQHIGSFSMTEVGHGSNVRGIGTVAEFDAETDEFIIDTPNDQSMKFWIGNSAESGTHTVVFAQLHTQGKNQGVHAILCPLRHPQTGEITPGITIRDCGMKQGWQAVPNGCLRFDKVRVPRHNLLNRYAEVNRDGSYTSPIAHEGKRFAETLSALVFGRLLYIMGPTKSLELCLTVATRYAMQRRQFGSPKRKQENLIWSYPTHKNKIVPLIAMVHAFNASYASLAKQYADIKNLDMAHFHAIISGVKAYVAEFVPHALLTLRPMCGGHGYSENNRIGRLMNDMDVFCTAEGDSTVLYQQLARYLVTEYKKKYASSSGNQVTSALQFMFDRTKTSLIEKNPITVRNTSEGHLRDTELLRQLFAARSSELLHEATKKLMANRRQHPDATDAWNAALVPLNELAIAYVHTTILNCFVQQIENCQDAQVKKIWSLLCQVYAIDNIVNDLGFFCSRGYLKPCKAIAFEQLLPKIYGELESFIPAIIDSFNIPDFLLMSPLGLSNMDYVGNTLRRVNMPSIDQSRNE